MNLMLVTVCVGILILISGAFFSEFKKVFITEPLLSLVIAILLSPAVFGLIELDIQESHSVLKKTCEYTIAMALMATALRIPRGFYLKNFKTQTSFILFGMLLMWLSSAIILYWILGINIPTALLIGAIVTPTDPVVASTIITGKMAEKFLPAKVRNTLSFEAGANDGLAFPLVAIGLSLIETREFSISNWLGQSLLYETLLCALIAYIIGHFSGLLLHSSNKRGYMNKKSFLPFSLALSFVLLEGLNLLKMNGIIAVFIGGLAFSRVISKNEDVQEERVQETMERIFTIPVYFLLGLVLPWKEYISLGWTAVWIILLILLFRRIPALLAMSPFLPTFKNRKRDLLLMGWFGPIGVAALYYAIHVQEKTGLEQAWTVPSLIVFASTVIHGISSIPVEKWYYRFRKKETQK
jgi:NhaP-type Na+/H+ or K+/H+ antiporter